MQICDTCKTESPDDASFCAACGASLRKLPPSLESAIRAAVDKAAVEAVREKVTDRDVVEVRIAAAIAERLMGWVKLYAVVVGSVLALIVVVLTLLGYQTYAELQKRIELAKQEVEPRLNAARIVAKKVETDSAQLRDNLTKQRAELAALMVIGEEVNELTGKVAKLEDIAFEPLEGVSRSEVAALQSALNGFRLYLGRLGYASSRPVRVVVGDKVPNAFYDEATRRLVIGRAFMNAPDALYYAYTQRALEDIAGAWTSDPKNPRVAQIRSALCDYYSASYRNDPQIGLRGAEALGMKPGEPIRDLSKNRSFEDLNKIMDPQGGGEIWGSAFWALRDKVGQSVADRLVLDAWKNIDPKQPETGFDRYFGKLLINADTRLFANSHGRTIGEILRARGLKMQQ